MRAGAGALVATLMACGAGPITASAPSSTHTEEQPMTGTTSPTGEPHPGQITHVDQIAGRTWDVAASGVPQTVAWAKSAEGWTAVVRIEITGTAERRRMTSFGPDGAMLQSTIQAPPPR